MESERESETIEVRYRYDYQCVRHLDIYRCLRTYICIYVWICVRTYVSMHVCMYVCMYVCVFHYRHSLCYFSIELPLIYLSIPCTPPPFFKLLLRTSTILPPYCPLPSTYVLEQSRTPSFKGSASDDDMI